MHIIDVVMITKTSSALHFIKYTQAQKFTPPNELEKNGNMMSGHNNAPIYRLEFNNVQLTKYSHSGALK